MFWTRKKKRTKAGKLPWSKRKYLLLHPIKRRRAKAYIRDLTRRGLI